MLKAPVSVISKSMNDDPAQYLDENMQSFGWLADWLFYGVSTLVGYLIPNHVYAYILNIHDS